MVPVDDLCKPMRKGAAQLRQFRCKVNVGVSIPLWVPLWRHQSPQGGNNEFGAVVHSQMRCSDSDRGDGLDDFDDFVGVDAVIDPYRQGFAGEPVDPPLTASNDAAPRSRRGRSPAPTRADRGRRGVERC